MVREQTLRQVEIREFRQRFSHVSVPAFAKEAISPGFLCLQHPDESWGRGSWITPFIGFVCLAPTSIFEAEREIDKRARGHETPVPMIAGEETRPLFFGKGLKGSFASTYGRKTVSSLLSKADHTTPSPIHPKENSKYKVKYTPMLLRSFLFFFFFLLYTKTTYK